MPSHHGVQPTSPPVTPTGDPHATDQDGAVALFQFADPWRAETMGHAPTHRVTAEAVEQLMRVTDREELVLLLLAAAGRGREVAAAATGKVLSQLSPAIVLPLGCPLLSFSTGSDLDVHWRRKCPEESGSLFAQLVLLRDLNGPRGGSRPGQFDDAYAELEAVRSALC